MDFNQVLETLEAHLDLIVAAEARRRLFVHAGVVGWRGRAILIPGPSGSGKTSLVAALIRAGATYYSDEYAVFDPRGRVHPYPRPLSIRGEPGEPRRPVPASDLGARTGVVPLPVGLTVVTQHYAGGR
jgi:hypothetical protein